MQVSVSFSQHPADLACSPVQLSSGTGYQAHQQLPVSRVVESRKWRPASEDDRLGIFEEGKSMRLALHREMR